MSFSDWLISNDAIKCILVEVDAKISGSETTLYLSTMAFSNGPTVYDPVVRGNSISIVEKLNVPVSSTAGTMSYGDIEIENGDHSRDGWLNYIWHNRACRVYMGDIRWDRSNFELIYDGIVAGIGSRSTNTLNLKLRDKLQRLNSPMSDAKLGGSTNNKNELLPLLIGECHNVTPLLTNPATLEYQWHIGASERLIEVRDEGVPVGTSNIDLSTSKFTLAARPAGRITISAQGAKPSGWVNRVAESIQHIVTTYGEANTRFTLSDIDQTNFNNFNSTYSQPIGIYIRERHNVLNVCQNIAGSIGAQIAMDRNGLLKLYRIDLSSLTPIDTITTSDIIANSLHISEITEVQAAQKIGYCRNWTVQNDLQTRVATSSKDLYAKEWLTASATDNTTKSDYKLDEEPPQNNTLLLTGATAQAEADRLLNMYKLPRRIIRLQGIPRLIERRLGDHVTVIHPHFDLSAGKNGVVIGISINWFNALTTLEILME